MGNKKYSVFSNGQILGGFDRQHVISELAQILNIPKEIISVSLLSGSSRKLQSFNSRLEAEKLVSKFSGLGLDCFIIKFEQ